MRVREAGKRHSADDLKIIQTIHDSVSGLGASCVRFPWESDRPEKGLWEAALAMNQSHDARRGHIQSALMLAHGVVDRWSAISPYVMDLFDSFVVYSLQNQMFKRSYTIAQGATGTDPKVTLGKAIPVHRAYMDSATESATASVWNEEGVIITSEDSSFTEGVTLDMPISEAKGTVPVPVKIIAPGWGSSGYYSKEMLSRDGPNVFKKGTHMYWNHATEAQEKARPEGDLSNLAAVLMDDAKWEENGVKGPGLYSSAKVFSDYADQVKEKGPHIGVSIRAYGKAQEGEAEGKKGLIIQSLTRGESVDFVTRAGAGGLPLVEGERPGPHSNNEETQMTEQEQATLREALKKAEDSAKDNAVLAKEVARLTAESNQAIATAAFITAFQEKGIELSVDAAKLLGANPPLKEGKVDLDAIKKVAEGFKGFKKPAGKVTGLGATTEVDDDEKKNLEGLSSALSDGFGLNEAALKIAMGGRV